MTTNLFGSEEYKQKIGIPLIDMISSCVLDLKKPMFAKPEDWDGEDDTYQLR